MLEAQYGIMAMAAADRDCTFVKKVAHDRNAAYPLGTNLAFYVGPDNFMVEMETMGPLATLKAGERLVHRETWVLAAASLGVEDAAGLRGLFGV